MRSVAFKSSRGQCIYCEKPTMNVVEIKDTGVTEDRHICDTHLIMLARDLRNVREDLFIDILKEALQTPFADRIIDAIEEMGIGTDKERIEELEGEVEDLRDEIRSLENQNSDLDDDLCDSEGRVTELERDLEEKSDQLAEALIKLKEYEDKAKNASTTDSNASVTDETTSNE